MAASARKLPVKHEAKKPPAPAASGWEPLVSLRKEIDRLFERLPSVAPFRHSLFGADPFWRREWSVGAVPAVDIVEKDAAYEISAELPGMEEKNIEVSVAHGILTIRGEKEESKEEKKKGYHLSERHYGSYQRSFGVPEGIDTDKVAAVFKNGVLTVTLPKSADAQSKAKKVAVSAK